MSLGRIYNDDCFECIHDIANECEHPVIVTDPPFNIGYHYHDYSDHMDEGELTRSQEAGQPPSLASGAASRGVRLRLTAAIERLSTTA